MAAPVLLVHDDLATIAAVRRLLTREGYDVVLATSAADAIIAFGHHLPGLIVLAPSVEGDRGRVVLEELAQHPDAKLVRMLLLGESIPGFGAPVAPLPLDATFIQMVHEAARTPADGSNWQVFVGPHETDASPMEPSPEPEPWRASAPAPLHEDWGQNTDRTDAVVQAALEQTYREVEAEATAVVDSTLAEQGRAFEPEPEQVPVPAPAANEVSFAELNAELEKTPMTPPPLTPIEAERVARAEAERQARAEISRLELEREVARDEAARRSNEASQQEVLARRAADRAEVLADRERAAQTAVTKAREAADAARRAAEATTQRLEQEAEALRAREQKLLQQAEVEAALRNQHEAQLEAQREEALVKQQAAEEIARRAREEALEGRRALEEVAHREREELLEGKRAMEEAAHNAEEAAREQQRLAQAAIRAERDARVQLEAQLEAARQEALTAKAEASQAQDEAKVLASVAFVPLAGGADAARVPAGGSLGLGPLAAMVLTLTRARTDIRLELKAGNTLRTLWLQRGTVAAALSSLPQESLLDRARRDGLIGAEQEKGLRLLRNAPGTQVLEALRAEGHLREAEVVPLVQRHTEQVTLEALGELHSGYRLASEPIPPEVPRADLPRPLFHLLAEALRRTMEPDSVLAQAGLAGSVEPLEAIAGLEAFGFSDRERRALAPNAGPRTLEAFLSSSGMRQEAALKLLGAAELLGLVEIRAGVPSNAVASPEVDVHRLTSKLEQIQEGDYFAILGLTRAAGGEEVTRAFTMLAAEFHPLKFAAHPDPQLQHRAKQIHAALEEAAHVLLDDRLRAAYARHLVD